MKGSWKKISSKLIYKNFWLEFIEDKVIDPNGNRGIYSFVKKAPGLIMVPVAEDGKIYLVGQWRYPVGKYSWELPMGGQEKGETLLQSGKRELNEETGLAGKKWRQIGNFYYSNGTMNQIGYIYLVNGLSISKKINSDKTEKMKVKKYSILQIKKMILENKITDSPTITAFYKYLLNK